MKFIRILNAVHYDARKQRFTSLAFKNSTGGGISVIHYECILAQNQTACRHIEQFYPPPTSSQPPIFWIFDETRLPADFTAKQQTTQSGDICHYNLLGVSDKAARDLLLRQRLMEFQICENETSRPLTSADLGNYSL
jgi:hypothetical protein